MCFPSFAFGKIHPFVALANDRGVSPSAEGDQGAAFGNRKLLKKLDQNFHCFGSAELPDKSKFENGREMVSLPFILINNHMR